MSPIQPVGDTERWKRDRGMARAEQAASDTFKRNVISAIRYLASKPEEFNTDDVRARMELLDQPIERPLAIGSIMAALARKALIYKTGNRRQTRIEGGHLRDYPMWKGWGW